MKIASITEAKNSLSALIDRLKSGSPVLIIDRGRPLARLGPVTGTTQEHPDGRPARLLRNGVIRPRRSEPPLALFNREPPSLRSARSGVEALIEERREAR